MNRLYARYHGYRIYDILAHDIIEAHRYGADKQLILIPYSNFVTDDDLCD